MPNAFRPSTITTEHLTKRYENTTALDDVSIEVRAGEIMGFLGPNGAGKTTTLRILTGLIAPTDGTVRVDKLDVETQSLEIRRRIGYLPENVALYPEMRVTEFLAYRARLKGVAGHKVGDRVAESIGRCDLGDVRRKLIGQLSKGYRQRVGLADCLVGQPSLLILDEPTVGLDPHQIRQTRDLIKSLGAQTTIFLSTHILPEVEMICDRVTIINGGKIIAVDTPDSLRRRLSGSQIVRVELKGDAAAVTAALGKVPGVQQVRSHSESGGFTAFELDAETGSDVREAVFRLAVEQHWPLRHLARAQASLEDVFIRLTTQETA